MGKSKTNSKNNILTNDNHDIHNKPIILDNQDVSESTVIEQINKKTKKIKKIKSKLNDEDELIDELKIEEKIEDKVNLKQNNSVNLTEDQIKIFNELVEFVSKPTSTSNEILLIGYAGTGKTTLVTKLICDLVKLKICKKISIVAPTHKAVNIAKSKLFDNIESSKELSKNINIMTIHRLLNYQSYIDSNTGEKYFAKSKVDPNLSIYDLIVVDECSMLSNQIITDISDLLANPINSKVKIIYVGDPAQLPPVNQTDSKIFTKFIKKLTLDNIIRTNNNKIMELSGDHRKWIFSKKNEDIPNIFKYKCDQINLYSIQNKEITKWLDNYIKITCGKDSKYLDNYDNNIILTWTNKKCNNYNQYVRQKIFNKKDLDHYEIGEILIFNDFYRYAIEVYETDQINKSNKSNNPNNEEDENIKKNYISFYTSEQVKLVQMEKTKYKLDPIKFKLNPLLTSDLNDKFKKKFQTINEIINVELDTFTLHIKRISEVKTDEINAQIHTIYTIHPKSEKKFSELNELFENIVIKLRKNCYKNIEELKKDNMTKCNLQAEVDKKLNKLYKDWQANVIDKFAQLNYGYSITVHKSQGSTFKNVFIDISDILENNNIDETSKCLYTAITRSSNSLELLI